MHSSERDYNEYIQLHDKPPTSIQLVRHTKGERSYMNIPPFKLEDLGKVWVIEKHGHLVRGVHVYKHKSDRDRRLE